MTVPPTAVFTGTAARCMVAISRRTSGKKTPRIVHARLPSCCWRLATLEKNAPKQRPTNRIRMLTGRECCGARQVPVAVPFPAAPQPGRTGHFRGLAAAALAVGEAIILLHPPLLLVGASIAMERERQQNDSLADGQAAPPAAAARG